MARGCLTRGRADNASQLARAKEVAQINRHADALNAEAADVLSYQREV